MKKVFIAVAVMFTAVTMSSAQVFVGGGLGVDFAGGKIKSGSTSVDKPTGFGFNFTPKVGYHLNDDFAVGMEVSFMSLSLKKPKGYTSYSDDRKTSIFGWGVNAFARYRLAGDDKLSLLLEGSLGVAGAKVKEKTGSNTTESGPVTSISIGVLPVLSYNLTDKLSIEASCDFLRFGFSSTTVKSSGSSDFKNTTNTFGFGANTPAMGIDEDDGPTFSNFFNVGLVFKF